MASTLPVRLLEHVRDHRLFVAPGTALLAVSGGSDSVAMLELLARIGPELGLELAVAHVDHGIAPESGEVAEQVRKLAETHGLTCHVAALELGSDASETCARAARYGELRKMQRELGAKYLVTAHHLDDQAETVLFRVLKGSGVAGLAGIPERGPEGLVRPLLPFRRSELEEWVTADVYHDPANQDVRHDRSWLRHRLMTVVTERFGDDAVRRLGVVASWAGKERDAWAALVRALPELGFQTDGNAAALARVPLQRYDNVLSEALLRTMAREVGCTLGAERTTRLLEFVRSSQSGRVMELGEAWEAELTFDKVRILRAQGAHPPPKTACGTGASGSVRWGSWEIKWDAEPAGRVTRRGFETWVTPGAMSIRAGQLGDRIVPHGGIGGRKVRRLLMEERVSFRERGAYPILERGPEILWVPGVCRSNAHVPHLGDPAVRVEARRPEDRVRLREDR
jgi:tRNA(Ile)-lysidine synthase